MSHVATHLLHKPVAFLRPEVRSTFNIELDPLLFHLFAKLKPFQRNTYSLIALKYKQMGGDTDPLGKATGFEIKVRGAEGRYQVYEHGMTQHNHGEQALVGVGYTSPIRVLSKS